MWQRLKFWRQFSLKTLLLAMLIAAVFCGAYRLGFKAGRSERLTSKTADFDALIELITSTIAPNTWEDAGGTNTALSVDSGWAITDIEAVEGRTGPIAPRSFAVQSADADSTAPKSDSPLPNAADPFR
jgi:hypothetical protein